MTWLRLFIIKMPSGERPTLPNLQFTGWLSVNAEIKQHRLSKMPKSQILKRNSPHVALMLGHSGKGNGK